MRAAEPLILFRLGSLAEFGDMFDLLAIQLKSRKALDGIRKTLTFINLNERWVNLLYSMGNIVLM